MEKSLVKWVLGLGPRSTYIIGPVSCYVTLQRRLVSKHHRLMLLRYKMAATL